MRERVKYITFLSMYFSLVKLKYIKVMDIMEIIKNRKWTWAGHISRRTDNRWSAAMTAWTPMSSKINRGRQ